MKHTLLVCSLIMWALGAWGQEFDTHWISVPDVDSTSHVWFRQTYMMQGRPQEGTITVASKGLYKLYVNEYNVGRAAFYPTRAPYSDHVVVSTFDVTPYLRPDTNVVAFIYSPSYPHVDTKQVAVSFSGRDHNGQPFAHYSDDTWLCRRANSSLNMQGGEDIDGREHDPSWKATVFAQALWRHVIEQRGGPTEPITLQTGGYPITVLAHRWGYAYFDLMPGGVDYEMGRAYTGWVRLTLREARRGETIWFDNSSFVCNGELDEQACPQFATSFHRRVSVRGDNRFERAQIVDIEAIETATQEHPLGWP